MCKFDEKEKKVSPVDLENSSIGYHIGRMIATYISILEEGNPNDTILTGNYYIHASSTPAYVLGLLSAQIIQKLGKIREINPERAEKYNALLGEISSKIGSKMPTSLCCEEQSLYALGNLHQRVDIAEFF